MKKGEVVTNSGWEELAWLDSVSIMDMYLIVLVRSNSFCKAIHYGMVDD